MGRYSIRQCHSENGTGRDTVDRDDKTAGTETHYWG